MKVTVTPRSPELRRIRRKWALSDGATMLSHGRATGTYAEVRALANRSRMQNGEGQKWWRRGWRESDGVEVAKKMGTRVERVPTGRSDGVAE